MADPPPKSIMNTDTYKNIVTIQDEQSHWQQSFVVDTAKGQVDLSVAIGNNEKCPPNISCHTKKLPNCSHYLFDPKRFCGRDSIKDITALIQSSCLGYSMYI